jgi:hypothetical protein
MIARLLSDAKKVTDVWSKDPTVVLGLMTLEQFNAAVEAAEVADTEVETARNELSGKVDRRDDRAAELQLLITRARSGMRAAYGPNSPEYGQVGVIRSSERKPVSRTVSVPADTQNDTAVSES